MSRVSVPKPDCPVPPPLPKRIWLKLRRTYLDLTGPKIDPEWRRALSMSRSIPGWLNPEQKRWLFDAACNLPSETTIVEIGSFKGLSTCFLASGCRGTSKLVFAVDTFNGNDVDFGHRDFFNEFSANIERTGLSHYVRPVVGISWEVAKTWKEPIHLLFIDGSHRYEDVLRDFEGFFPHVVPGGLVAFHDVGEEDWPGPLRAWNDTFSKRLVKTGHCSTLAYGYKPEEKP